ncbi:hypothetical protein [Lichenibacterium ramalinae]|uniref:Uncharacterized protein n=1 Tax=Lichenibacterium ramalinae TaxID=2316527 RepID=A0A4Q2RCL6_9HYPH|nr:hypothetical protein [Lichenibacterium ramalinae]RYB03573.1 hypothetical protein D3272_15575 [Lichenibacterium ramalinae]
MGILYSSQDNTEGYTDAELRALNKELDARVEEARELAEEAGQHFFDEDEEMVSKAFADEVARR